MEETAARWLVELYGLPARSSVGFVTGGQMANFTCLAAARHEVLRRAGWDVESKGLIGAPTVHVVTHKDTHVTIYAALRLLGLGVPPGDARVASDGQGRVRIDDLARTLDALPEGPAIVCVQAGNVNSGAFDALDEAAGLCARRGAWLHVDGAFGLWAAAVPSLRHLVPGIERADSWAVDAHKWLNVPYDCGIAICAHPEAHRASMTATAAYLIPSDGDARDGVDWAPEFSRRARGVTAYAALRALGRDGVVDLVERGCRLARRFAEALAGHERVRVLNDVVLNQVLVRFDAEDASEVAAGDARTRAIVSAVQKDGTCWMSGTDWHGLAAMRISVSNWSTTEGDVDRAVAAILRIAAKS
jgi:glutamate/tyrosine decarboxylase-like PLP-dependent enzyme